MISAIRLKEVDDPNEEGLVFRSLDGRGEVVELVVKLQTAVSYNGAVKWEDVPLLPFYEDNN